MIIISHRGNLNGPNTAHFGENHPSSIRGALSAGFSVEVDVRYDNKKFILGHDAGEWEVSSDFFYNDKLFVHAKDILTLRILIDNPIINLFYHFQDDCTLTSRGYIWSFPRASVQLTNRSIAVLPELIPEWDLSSCYGICTDLPNKYLANIK